MNRDNLTERIAMEQAVNTSSRLGTTELFALGAGCLHAWAFSVMTGGLLSPQSVAAFGRPDVGWFLVLAGALAVWAALLVRPARCSLPLFPALSVLQLACMLLTTLPQAAEPSPALPTLVATGCLTMGIGYGLQISEWGHVARTLPANKAAAAPAFMYAVGGGMSALTAIVGTLLGRLPAIAVAACYIVVSGTLLVVVLRQHASAPIPETTQFRRASAESRSGAQAGSELASVTVFLACFGFVVGSVGALRHTFSNFAIAIAVGILTALLAAVCGYTAIERERPRNQRIMAGASVLAAIGVAALSAIETGLVSILCILIGVRLIDMVSWTVASKWETEASEQRRSFLLGRLSIYGGTFFGLALNMAFSSALNNQNAPADAVPALLLILIILGTLVFFYHGQTARTDSGEQDATNPRRPMKDFYETYGIAPEDAEILSLFADGRSASYIAERLLLSESTVRSRIRHAYSRMDVHSRRELIDLKARFELRPED